MKNQEYVPVEHQPSAKICIDLDSNRESVRILDDSGNRLYGTITIELANAEVSSTISHLRCDLLDNGLDELDVDVILKETVMQINRRLLLKVLI
jgi:hypothetical protein